MPMITPIVASGIGCSGTVDPLARRGTRAAISRPCRSMKTQITTPGISMKIVPCSPSAHRISAPTSGPEATPSVPPVT